jgi:hypothetical protein
MTGATAFDVGTAAATDAADAKAANEAANAQYVATSLTRRLPKKPELGGH